MCNSYTKNNPLQLFRILTFIRMIKTLELKGYKEAHPYPHGCFDNFLETSFANNLHSEIIGIEDSKWDRYENPFESKYTLRDKWSFPEYLKQLFVTFESDTFIKNLSEITGHDLLLDETRNFWGVHKYKAGDKLDIHVDAGYHPANGLKKQVTLGLYLSKDWGEKDGCELEIWEGSSAADPEPKLTRLSKKISPVFNRLVLFDCADNAWHGNPEPCMKDGRIFITISYMSNNMLYMNKKVKAYFIKRPNDPDDPEKDRLRMLRADPARYKEIYRT